MVININSNMNDKLLKPYDSNATETAIYKRWEDSGFFNPDVCIEKGVTKKDAESFTITLPPPNVTGVLHIGHSYEDTLQDVAIRYARMSGKKTLWVPGTDSAAIATQARVEKNIQKEEKKSRHDIGREELVSRVKKFAKEHEHIILNQIRKMGASLDWSRYAYTLDDKRYEAVMTAFKNMYTAGLIYRGHRIVNWDPKGQTTVSDDEVVHEERKGKLYTFKYSKDFPISIATTRPETKLGDTAVAVHPDDPRYKEYIGKEYTDIPFAGAKISIKIVGDKEVDPELGTGAVGVTPAHSMVDWGIKERHDLKVVQVINEYAKMMVGNEDIKDKKTTIAREAVVAWLENENLLEKVDDIIQNISLAERSGGIIEPLPMLQWFVAVNKPFKVQHSEIPKIKAGDSVTLKELMRATVEHGAVQIPQERFKKSYFHWIDNLHDWCISRQIWFGHRIPVWYQGEKMHVGMEAPTKGVWEQDSDVLDTWFSSALWTFSTLGWPEQTKDIKVFHPTSFMSPAYEILNLWVSRMILMSGFHLGQAPFKTVLIHGVVRDKQGRKFSKSLGNGINPIDIIDKYGADALRMGLLTGTAIGNDVSFDENKIKGYKHFANKIWNITRFILSNTEGAPSEKPTTLSETDQKNIDELNNLTTDITKELDNYNFYLAAEKLYHYVWHRLADEILEESKPRISDNNIADMTSLKWTLREILTTILKLLHPFMPFITEEIWSILHNDNKDDINLLMIQKWPEQK